jgi:hypothetical protein
MHAICIVHQLLKTDPRIRKNIQFFFRRKVNTMICCNMAPSNVGVGHYSVSEENTASIIRVKT